jgi:hypothetical protein
MKFQLAGAHRASLEDVDLNELAKEIFAENVERGWWDDWPNRMDRFEIAMGLVVTEFAEAIEGVRKDLMDDHLPNHKMMHVEIADAAIRALDMAGALADERGDDLLMTGLLEQAADFFVVHNAGKNPIAQLCACCEPCVYRAWANSPGVIVARCHAMSLLHNFDLWGIIEEKRAYNATRPDHKRENRAKEGGKKW